jgi:fumarate hydratase class II
MIRWGEQTERAIVNFPVSGQTLPNAFIRALALVKAEAAFVNASLGTLDPELAVAIQRAANEIVAGAMTDQFPVDVYQTGSGTSTNMNVNEVIAHRATELCQTLVHPNDHVNASQSSNDTVPSAIRISAAIAITSELLPAFQTLAASLVNLSRRHRSTVKMARTHLMDAVPMTFGQEAGAWARSVQLAGERVESVMPRLCELPIGGTAVGTGLNAPNGYATTMVERIATRTGIAFVEAIDHFEAQSTLDTVVELSAVLKVAALAMNKIAIDLRLLASGPAGGLGEVRLPALQAGSSIMPGKVNPVMPEMVQQVAARVVGNDAAVTFAAGSCSMLQLPTALPMVAHSVLESIGLLTRASELLAERCVDGIEVDADRMKHNAMASPALATALAPTIGYEAAAEVVREAASSGRPVAELITTGLVLNDAGEIDLLALTRRRQGGTQDGC